MSEKPNILFFYPDQLRFDWLGCHGTASVRTPHIDSLSARGVRFTNAVCPSPLCSPSRAALAQGVEYDSSRVPDNDHNLPGGVTSFYKALQTAGGERPKAMTARSLIPVLTGEKTGVRDRVYSGLGEWRMVYDGTWKYVSNFEGDDYLFNREEDPREFQNYHDAKPEIVAELKSFL